jgi:hypothetical protein
VLGWERGAGVGGEGDGIDVGGMIRVRKGRGRDATPSNNNDQ